MSHSQKATSSKTSSHFLVLSNHSLKEGYVDPQSLSIFLKNLDLCASCSEGVSTSPNPVYFLPLPHVLALFDLLPCILMCLTPRYPLLIFVFVFFTFFFLFLFILQVFTVFPQLSSLLLHQCFPLLSFNYKSHSLHIYLFSFCGTIAFAFFFHSLPFYWCSS